MQEVSVPVEMTAAEDLARRQAAGLRALADMIEQNPGIAELAKYYLTTFSAFSARSAEEHATLAKLALKYGATVSKDVTSTQYNLEMSFAGGALVVSSLANREEVCERVVVGTETVTKQVPDPAYLEAAPMVAVTEQVERVEWFCRPLLADAAAVSS